MGLMQNGYRDRGTGNWYAGLTSWSGAIPPTLLGNFNQPGRIRNLTAGEGITDDKVGIPAGTTHPVAWMLPQKAGLISARLRAVNIIAAGAILAGFPIVGTADIDITVPDATAELVAFGTGSSEIELESTGTLSGSINGEGSASVSVSGNTSLLGAIASGDGAANISLSTTASILPIDDTSPAREASASFAITGSLTPYAVGFMIGNALPYTELSPQSLAAAIWDKTAAEHNVAGTMGNKLNTASSGGVDLSAMSDAVWQHQFAGGPTAGDTLVSTLNEAIKGRKMQTNKAIISGDGLSVSIYEDDGTTLLHTFSVSADKNTRTPV